MNEEKDKQILLLLEKMNNQIDDVFNRVRSLGEELGQYVYTADLEKQSKDIQDNINKLYWEIDSKNLSEE